MDYLLVVPAPKRHVSLHTTHTSSTVPTRATQKERTCGENGAFFLTYTDSLHVSCAQTSSAVSKPTTLPPRFHHPKVIIIRSLHTRNSHILWLCTSSTCSAPTLPRVLHSHPLISHSNTSSTFLHPHSSSTQTCVVTHEDRRG